MRSLFLFRCFRQEWLLILLTTVLILLTALQANGSVLTKNIPLVSHSGSYSIFFLRVISELAGLSLAATLAVTLEQVKWAIVTIGSGGELTEASRAARLVEFLALDIGTTIPGLLRLLVSPSISSLKARLWSLGRLITMIVVPVTGVLIMSMSQPLCKALDTDTAQVKSTSTPSSYPSKKLFPDSAHTK